MGKGKPRHNPDKPANKMGEFCQASDGLTCHCGNVNDLAKCKENPHNCIKTYYARLASRSNIQIINGVDIRR